MKFSLKQLMTAGLLLAASATAFADVSVPAGYENSATAPNGNTTNTDEDGGLVFYLFNTGDTTYSLTYNLGLDLSDFTYSATDDGGLTLTWNIDTSLYSDYSLTDMVWGVNAGDNGSQSTDGSMNLLTTIDAGSITTLTNTGVLGATNAIETAYSGANLDTDPEDVNTTAYNQEDVKSNVGTALGGIAGMDWTASAADSSDTLEMYYYAQNGGRGQGDAEALSTKYAGVWSFDASSGTLTYTVAAVPVPAALWLLLSGLGGLGVVSRRRVAA